MADDQEIVSRVSDLAANGVQILHHPHQPLHLIHLLQRHAGQVAVVGAQKVTVTVQAVAPNGLEIDWVDPPAFSFVNLGACGQLTTLALTGTAVTYLGWTLGGGALFLGAALLFMRRRSEKAGD